ncbi:MAG: M14 family murein peptide amidase A [Hylemonella sp.]|uniref:M14 family murein peptide amidase A n=1 Tax=Hylemonella sp. TaxID=2066020 RepID=UPI0022C9EC83|nr:M14 family murein peptide amidase A [Hylemonella sp.]MCZ8252787.1 M14 family murein peptide amidase A [Hylemonella sp.]
MRFWKSLVAGVAALTFTLDGAANDRTCGEFFSRLPNVSWALCQTAQLQASEGRSVRGRTIYVRDVRPVMPRLRVLVIGGMHGDELSSAAVALHWIRLAQTEPEQVHWRFIPALNPDGLFDQPARRVNANGVDLNRNFPTPNWERDATYYWEVRTRKDPRRFPGRQPLSEPETRFLHDEMMRFRPNLIVSIHAPYGILDFDGPTTPPRRLGRLYLDQLGVFPGSLGNYGGVHKGMPVVTIELPSARLTPRNVEIQRMWTDLRDWMGMTLAGADDGGQGPAMRR